MVEEARLEQLEAGLTPVSDGWFVVNVRDGAWVTNGQRGTVTRPAKLSVLNMVSLEGEGITWDNRVLTPTIAAPATTQPSR